MSNTKPPARPRPSLIPTRSTRSWRSMWLTMTRLIGGVGIGIGVGASPALAQAPARPAPAKPGPQTVPQHWISYAQLVGNQLQDRLGDAQSDAVQRLHAWMQARLLKEGQTAPPEPLVVRVWIGPEGRIGQLEFKSLGQAQADADLRNVLATEPLSEPPPRDMRQPMVLQLALSFAVAG